MNTLLARLAALGVLLLALGCERAPPDIGTGTGSRELSLAAAPGARLPRLAAVPDGGLWLSWVEPRGEDAHALRYARLAEGRWSEPATIAEGRDWFVNWADFPSVLPLSDGAAAAHWLIKRPGGTYAYDVAVAVSGDGHRWSPPIIPHDDGTATEHGFVTLYPDGDAVGAVWLDGREMTEGAAGHGDGHHGGGAMTLRTGLIDRAGVVVSGTELDSRTCDCCQTGAVQTDAGPVVVYRDRSREEVRDIRVVARRNGVWNEPRAVADDGWLIEACPVNGPAIAAAGPLLAVAWFTAADDRPRVQVAFSQDAAESFEAPIEVADDGALGRVGIVMPDERAAIVSWVASTEAGAEIRYRRVPREGVPGPVYTLVRIAASRSAGFPQMGRGGDGLVFAWTIPGEPAGVRTATVPLPR